MSAALLAAYPIHLVIPLARAAIPVFVMTSGLKQALLTPSAPASATPFQYSALLPNNSRNATVVKYAAVTFVWNCLAHSSSSSDHSASWNAFSSSRFCAGSAPGETEGRVLCFTLRMPALLKRMSMRPASAAMRAATDCRAGFEVMSAWRGRMLPNFYCG
jgi:hypothetical protein